MFQKLLYFRAYKKKTSQLISLSNPDQRGMSDKPTLMEHYDIYSIDENFKVFVEK